MTAMVQEFDGVRELSMAEVDAVAGAAPPLGAAVAIGGGVVGGATAGAMAYSEANSDGQITGSEALGVAGATVVGAGAGAVGAVRGATALVKGIKFLNNL
ncbi:hypothetical protein ACWCOP_00650 [Maricaulaceae bacterium MS644]